MCLKRDEGDDWVMLVNWDDDEFIWRRACKECENRQVVDMPIGTMHVIFRGCFVSDEVWAQAKTIFDKEM